MSKQAMIFELSRLNEFKRQLKDGDWGYKQGLREFLSDSEIVEITSRMEEMVGNRIKLTETSLKSLL